MNRISTSALAMISLLSVLLLVGCETTQVDGGAGPPDSNLTLLAVSGPQQINLLWDATKRVDLYRSSDPSCDWSSYSVCPNGGLIPDANGGRQTLSVEDNALIADLDYHFVAEAKGKRSPTVTARARSITPDTRLARLAADLEPGAFQPLNAILPEGFERYYDFLRANSFDPDTWNDSAHWDSARQQAFLYGDRRASVFLSYQAHDHSWRHLPLTNGPDPDHHVYGGVALDRSRGHYYREVTGRLHRFIIDEERWERLPVSFPGKRSGFALTDPIEWHDALGHLIYIRDYHVYGLADGRWIDHGRMAVNGYHSSAQYNGVRNEMLFMGGNESLRKVSVLDSDGRIRDLRDAPFDFSIAHSVLTYDPETGNYLVLQIEGVNKLWEFDPKKDQWRLAIDWSQGGWPFSRYNGVVPVPIDELGVILFLNEGGPKIYRHRSVFNTGNPVDPGDREADAPVDNQPPAGTSPNRPAPGAQPATSLLYEIAATMKPGEFRPVDTNLPPGVGSISAMNSTHWHPDDKSEGTFGVGWTDRAIFDEETGRLFNALMRGDYTRSITWLEPDLTWTGISPAPSSARIYGRRPYNRLMSGPDRHLYWAVSGNQMGRLTKAPFSDPSNWEDAGAPLLPNASSLTHAVGDVSTVWHPVIEKFVFYHYGTGTGDLSESGIDDYTQGHVWIWGPGDQQWSRPANHSNYDGPAGRTQSSGYGGTTLYNPIRREVLIYGGSANWNRPHPLGPQSMATIDEHGRFQRHGPSGRRYHARYDRLTYHPTTGDYILLTQADGSNLDHRMYIGDPPRGKPWRLLFDWSRISPPSNPERPLHGYENWHRVTPLPGTDVLIWSDLRRGIVLQRLPAGL